MLFLVRESAAILWVNSDPHRVVLPFPHQPKGVRRVGNDEHRDRRAHRARALGFHRPVGSGCWRLADVSGEYARQVGLGAAPRLLRVNGQVLRARTSVHGAGLRSGAVLIAALGAAPARSASADRAREEGADTEQRTARLPFVLAGLAAVLAGWLAAGIESPRL